MKAMLRNPAVMAAIAAAIAIVLLGILLDRITQGAGRRRESTGDGPIGEPVPLRPA